MAEVKIRCTTHGVVLDVVRAQMQQAGNGYVASFHVRSCQECHKMARQAGVRSVLEEIKNKVEEVV